MMTTIRLPAFSGLRVTSIVDQSAAPDEVPTSRQAFFTHGAAWRRVFQNDEI